MKIDMFSKSKRERMTQFCIIYARHRAYEFLGPMGRHHCDESCDHESACENCRFYFTLPEEVEEKEDICGYLGTANTCHIAAEMLYTNSITKALQKAKSYTTFTRLGGFQKVELDE